MVVVMVGLLAGSYGVASWPSRGGMGVVSGSDGGAIKRGECGGRSGSGCANGRMVGC